MTKKILACLLTVCLIATLIPMTLFAENEGIDLPLDDIEVTGVKKGDMNGDEQVDSDDAILLLMHSMFPEDYSINQDGDLDHNGAVDSDDAILLLMHSMFPEDYPLEDAPAPAKTGNKGIDLPPDEQN